MGTELGNFARRFLTDVNRDRDHAGKSANKNESNQPGRYVSDAQRMVKRRQIVDWLARMQKYFRHPRDHDENENEYVVAFQSPPDRFQFADLETRQNQIFADQLFPFTLEHLAILHHHRDEKVRFEHAHARAERVVETVTARLDPEHRPDDGEVKKENDVRHSASGKCDGNDGGAAGNCPVSGNVEPLPPDHDPSHFAAIKMRHRVDVSRIINAALQRDRRLLVRPARYFFSCHGYQINWITGFARIIQ